jgi:hypothetical protein
MNASNEKRRAPRIVLNAGSALGYFKKSDTEKGIISGKVYDISPYGVGISSEKLCPHNSEISVHFCTDKKVHCFKAAGKVIRCMVKNEKEYRVGIEFILPDGKLKDLVEDYVRKIKTAKQNQKKEAVPA